MIQEAAAMEISEGFFYKKKVIIVQHKKGYRFSVDAPILADFLPQRPESNALEIGTGCGIISMLALYKKKFSHIYGLEIQDSLCRLAKINADRNGFYQNYQVINGDFNEKYRDFEGINMIFANPPYYPLNKGRLSPVPEIRSAKFETTLTLKQLLHHCRSCLGKKGSLFLVLPYERFDECMTISRNNHLFPAKIRKVFSFKDGKAERFLVQLTNYGVSPEEMKPLIIFKDKGVYTEEMDRILTG